MTDSHLLDEADDCRKRAQAYVGQPEAAFLLKVAREFERLAHERRNNVVNVFSLETAYTPDIAIDSSASRDRATPESSR